MWPILGYETVIHLSLLWTIFNRFLLPFLPSFEPKFLHVLFHNLIFSACFLASVQPCRHNKVKFHPLPLLYMPFISLSLSWLPQAACQIKEGKLPLRLVLQELQCKQEENYGLVGIWSTTFSQILPYAKDIWRMFNDFVQYKIQSALKRTRINFYQRERERYAGQAGGAVSPWFQLDCGGCVAQAPKVPKKSDMLRNIRKTRSESLALRAVWAVRAAIS